MRAGPDPGAAPRAHSPELVLASTSVYRRTLLERLGVPFRWRAPLFHEDSLNKDRETDPRTLAETLAHAKAMSLVEVEPNAVIVGCDQVVAFGGRVFGKPGSVDRAIAQLSVMAGQTHQLITALVVVCGDIAFRHTDVTTLKMRPLSPAAIERYIAADQPLDCAGAYKLECCGIALFERIDSADHSAITGLPLIALVTILCQLGYEIP
jgi:septum formation protein